MNQVRPSIHIVRSSTISQLECLLQVRVAGSGVGVFHRVPRPLTCSRCSGSCGSVRQMEGLEDYILELCSYDGICLGHLDLKHISIILNDIPSFYLGLGS